MPEELERVMAAERFDCVRTDLHDQQIVSHGGGLRSTVVGAELRLGCDLCRREDLGARSRAVEGA